MECTAAWSSTSNAGYIAVYVLWPHVLLVLLPCTYLSGIYLFIHYEVEISSLPYTITNSFSEPHWDSSYMDCITTWSSLFQCKLYCCLCAWPHMLLVLLPCTYLLLSLWVPLGPRLHGLHHRTVFTVPMQVILLFMCYDLMCCLCFYLVHTYLSFVYIYLYIMRFR